jgi:hypothetical protein
MDGWVDEWMGGQVDEFMHGRMGGWMDGWLDGKRTGSYSCIQGISRLVYKYHSSSNNKKSPY